jgi:phenylacetic acid degradation operon negative regulatory protein
MQREPALRVKAPAMVFDLFGDFAVEQQGRGEIPMAAIVRLAAELRVRPAATRSAVHRLARQGWLSTGRRGRDSLIRLTPNGRSLIGQGRRRIFSPVTRSWDGRWTIIEFSVPEGQRDVRDSLRTRLEFLGFGSPSSGMYVSPLDYQDEVVSLGHELHASGYLRVFRAELLWPSSGRAFVARAWRGLAEVDRGYREFMRRFRSRLGIDRRAIASASLEPATAFRTRFELVYEFRRRLFGDPGLPPELAPASWAGLAARDLFMEYHDLVTPLARQFFRTTVLGTKPSGRAKD